ncbi:MAG: HPr family phosphocarrier protein [Planctomycetes bacterium]|nr:HPr family phosphocarrier protein [Planctomycetota bacterium]
MPTTQDGPIERTVEVRDKDGLHMRPAMEFVDCANQFVSRISVCKEDRCVDGKSIMQMTTLIAVQGTRLKIIAEGEDAAQAVASLVKVLENEAVEK